MDTGICAKTVYSTADYRMKSENSEERSQLPEVQSGSEKITGTLKCGNGRGKRLLARTSRRSSLPKKFRNLGVVFASALDLKIFYNRPFGGVFYDLLDLGFHFIQFVCA